MGLQERPHQEWHPQRARQLWQQEISLGIKVWLRLLKKQMRIEMQVTQPLWAGQGDERERRETRQRMKAGMQTQKGRSRRY
jgi:hypothetical protein